MLKHYLKVAFRNIVHYKAQSIISIVGLAAAFVCFSLTAIWFRYENSFDGFHPTADRVYRILEVDRNRDVGYYEKVSGKMGTYLKEHFPEIEEVTNIRGQRTIGFDEKYLAPKVENQNFRRKGIYFSNIDTSFFHVFGLSRSFISALQPKKAYVTPLVIKESVAKELFGETTDPIGIMSNDADSPKEISALLSGWGIHSEVRFEGLVLFGENDFDPNWYYSGYELYILLKRGSDKKAFEEKIRNLKIKELPNWEKRSFQAAPIRKLHVKFPSYTTFKYEYISLFAIAGGFLIINALINFLTIFLSRIKNRGRELILRKVNGSSGISLTLLLLTEFLLQMFVAVFLGGCILELIIPLFVDFVGIKDMFSDKLYRETFLFAFLLLGIALFVSFLPILYFKNKILLNCINGQVSENIRYFFRRISLLLQFVISLGLILVTSIFYLQIDYLQTSDLGFELDGIIEINHSGHIIDKHFDFSYFAEKIRNMPEIYVVVTQGDFFPNFRASGIVNTNSWQGIIDRNVGTIFYYNASPELFEFAGIRLLEGRIYREEEANAVVINETARRVLRSREGVLGHILDGNTIVGVVADSYVKSPLLPVEPVVFRNKGLGEDLDMQGNQVVIKAKKGLKRNAIRKVDSVFRLNEPNHALTRVDWKGNYIYLFLKSETNLVFLFTLVSIICILISLFGVYSLASLTCEQRRKEVAIHKVNGARLSDLFLLFSKDYFVLLLIASVIAFPIARFLMQIWLEQYTRQVSIGLFLYLLIFVSVALVVFLTVISQIHRVYKANPADEIRKE